MGFDAGVSWHAQSYVAGVWVNFGDPAQGAVTIPEGQTSAPITVAIVDDPIDEDDQTFFLTAGASFSWYDENELQVANPVVVGTGTVIDDDDPPTLSIDDVSVTEGELAFATFTVSLSAPSSKEITVAWSTADDGTATETEDYTPSSGTLTFAAYSALPKQVFVPINDDDIGDEFDETFFVNLAGAVNATLADGQGKGTIVDDDGVTPTDITLSNDNVNENLAAGLVGTLSATDNDVGDTHSFALVDGEGAEGNASFQIVGTELKTVAGLNFEEQNSYSIRIGVTDGAGLTFEKMFTIAVNDVNEAPYFVYEFTQIDVEVTEYTVHLGRNKEAGQEIEDALFNPVARAKDEDGDALSFYIASGNAAGHFDIDEDTGDLSLKVHANQLANETYTLEIGVDDGLLLNTANVAITVKDAVGIAGDTHAIEGTTDQIVIKFVRYSKPNAINDPGLTVTFDVAWITAWIGDLVNGFDRSAFEQGFVSFPANQVSATGQTVVTYQLGALNDGNPGGQVEGIEEFKVTLEEGQNYFVLDGKMPLDDPTLQSVEVRKELDFFILDGITLFAKHNPVAILDDTNGDYPIGAGNPGVHYNDIGQGSLNDCYLLAGMAALVNEDWSQIAHNFITDEGTYYNVKKLMNPFTGIWSNDLQVQKSSLFENGYDMAQLSGDFDPTTGAAEVWTIVLEKAYAQMIGGYGIIDGNNLPHLMYRAIMGIASPEPGIETQNMTNNEIWNEIDDVWGDHPVVLNTNPNQPQDSPLGGTHSYVVIGRVEIDSDGDGIIDVKRLKLYNPWPGEENAELIELDISELKSTIGEIYVLKEGPPPP